MRRHAFHAVDKSIDFFVICIGHPAAANQIFFAVDGEVLSTPDLLRRFGNALNKPARLLSVPSWLLKSGAVVAGQRDIIRRLCGSLQADIGKARMLLGWNPPVSVDEALHATARHFLENSSR